MVKHRKPPSRKTAAEGSSATRAPVDPKNVSLARLVRFNQVWFALCLQTSLGRFGLAAGMWHFVMALGEGDGITLRELSRRAGTMEPTTNVQIRRMERLGLVERREDDEDRRKVLVYLTRKGRALRTKLIPYAAEINVAAVEGFERKDVELMRDLLNRMLTNLSNIHTKLVSESKRDRR